MIKKIIVVSNCKNCGYNIKDVNFCSNCGAKKITKRITFKNLIAEISEVYLNVDNTFVKTVKDLTIKPHTVIDGYINGLRKKYLNVASYFLLSVTLSAILAFIKERGFDIASEPEKHDESSKIIQLFIEVTEKFPTLGYFVLIPFYAIISRFIFRKYKKYNFTEHIVINSYLTSHLTILTFIPYIISFSFGDYIEESSIVFLLIQLIYAIFLFKNLYLISYRKVIIKGIFGWMLVILIMIGIAIIYALSSKFLKENGFLN
ncbi:DUF3667 domain-containing protein [Aquimarina sp. 2201CG14-23]|uniref:DUF3667 domain-containing protein n=1 Tax=Aquimarina mycalae TaxID=3040073 RepID=UPI0024781C2E|nr:DUF3667 domain-containing protein [Aquimarina sp. 2201CG14-23]MDH7444716.1 DUF3667 domain-containing protein [Aquimarina sp. 2201CG14-23]